MTLRELSHHKNADKRYEAKRKLRTNEQLRAEQIAYVADKRASDAIEAMEEKQIRKRQHGLEQRNGQS